MPVFESWLYGDPETVAIRRENERIRKDKACSECIHKKSIEWKGEVHNACEFKRRVYGKRCELYRIDRSVQWDELSK